MNTEALKEQARRHEQREEWAKAIELYEKAVDQLAQDDQPDLSLYNRLGDLEIRVGNIERAVEHYERAIELYIESELPNNAIAICRKVVRNLPTRHRTFLKMGQIRARQGFLTDARNNFLEYAERMQRAEDLEEAFRALIEFVDLAPDDIEARTVLAAQLEAHERTSEAVEQYVAIHQRLRAMDRNEESDAIEAKIRALDPAVVIPPPRTGAAPPTDGGAPDELFGFETTALIEDFPTLEGAPESESHRDAIDPGALEIEDGPSDEPGYGGAAASEDGFGFEGVSDAMHEDGASPFDAVAEADFVVEPTSGTDRVDEERASDAGDRTGSDEAVSWETDAPVPWSRDHDGARPAVPTALAGDEAVDADPVDPDGIARIAAADADLETTPSPHDPLPLISFDDEEAFVGDVTGESDVPRASDFGVRHDAPEGEFVDAVAEVPVLDAGLDGGLGAPAAGEDVERRPDIAAAATAVAEPGTSVQEELVAALQAELEQSPDDPDTWLALAQEFQGLDRLDEARLAVGQAMERATAQDDLDASVRAAKAQISLVPSEVPHRQRLVELAIRKADEELLVHAYLGLADCLIGNGSRDQARAVYEQVLAVEPENGAAKAALGGLTRTPAAPATEVVSSEDYVDLGSLILDDETEKTTRWKVAAEEPSGDEAADFAKMLAQFKDKVAQNLEADDLAAHYDLGTAYKEMGLVDEAIYEFQQALRAESDHLPTHELLGQCFMEKGQYEVAVRSMNRALDSATEVEDELLGIYYQMARAHEELGNKGDALEFYEKVFALDINFQDVTERLRGLR